MSISRNFVFIIFFIIIYALSERIVAIFLVSNSDEYNIINFSLKLIILICIFYYVFSSKMSFKYLFCFNDISIIIIIISGLIIVVNIGHDLKFYNIIISAMIEECIFRGMLFVIILKNIKLDKFFTRVLFSFILESSLFGIIHYVNIFKMDLNLVHGQVIYALGMGLILTAIIFRFKNVYICGFVHGICNIVMTASSSVSNSSAHDSNGYKTAWFLLITAVASLIIAWKYDRKFWHYMILAK